MKQLYLFLSGTSEMVRRSKQVAKSEGIEICSGSKWPKEMLML